MQSLEQITKVTALPNPNAEKMKGDESGGSDVINRTALVIEDNQSLRFNFYKGFFNNLFLTTNATVDNIVITCDAISMEDVSGNLALTTGVSVTLNMSNGAANGVDTGGPATANTNYAIWLIFNSTTKTVASLASLSYTTPALPVGYTYKRLIGFVNIDATRVVEFQQINNLYFYLDLTGNQVLTAGTSTTLATVTITRMAGGSGIMKKGWFFGNIESQPGNNVDDFTLSVKPVFSGLSWTEKVVIQRITINPGNEESTQGEQFDCLLDDEAFQYIIADANSQANISIYGGELNI